MITLTADELTFLEYVFGMGNGEVMDFTPEGLYTFLNRLHPETCSKVYTACGEALPPATYIRYILTNTHAVVAGMLILELLRYKDTHSTITPLLTEEEHDKTWKMGTRLFASGFTPSEGLRDQHEQFLKGLK